MVEICPIWKAIIQNVRYEPHPWDIAREGALTGVDAAVLAIRGIHTAPYLIWSNEHQCWWAPNRCGYTTNIERAGRYDRDEAIKIASTARGGWRTGRNPDEIAIPEADAIEQALCPDRYEAWSNAERQS